jgi:hypothetical protein
MSQLNPGRYFSSDTLGCSFIVDKFECDIKRRKTDLKLVEKI